MDQRPGVEVSDAKFARDLEALRPQVRNLCCAILKDREKAEDATQDVMARAWKARANRDTSKKLSSWVLMITANMCRDHIRNGKRRVQTEAMLWLDRDGILKDLDVIDKSLPIPFAEEISEELINAVESLRPLVRRTFLMVLDGKGYAEIAEELSIPVGSVRSRLNRARHHIMRELARPKAA